MARAGPEGAPIYETLLRRAHDDPAILAFWLGGSRGMGRATPHSDWDIGIIVAENAYQAFCRELGIEGGFQADWRSGVDLMVRTFPMFEAFPSWKPEDRGYRYAFAHLRALVDKTGRAQPLIDAKARVPAEAAARFIHDSLDHALNQAYRALKCLRDGLPDASRLEAAEGVNPYLDAAFALHDRRLRPYYKYLRWELETWPLTQLPTGDVTLIDRALGVLGTGGGPALSALLAEGRDAFYAAGHGAAYDGWGATLDWILKGEPGATP